MKKQLQNLCLSLWCKGSVAKFKIGKFIRALHQWKRIIRYVLHSYRSYPYTRRSISTCFLNFSIENWTDLACTQSPIKRPGSGATCSAVTPWIPYMCWHPIYIFTAISNTVLMHSPYIGRIPPSTSTGWCPLCDFWECHQVFDSMWINYSAITFMISTWVLLLRTYGHHFSLCCSGTAVSHHWLSLHLVAIDSVVWWVIHIM